MINDLIGRLREECPSLSLVEEPSRILPIEREQYPVATVYLVKADPPETRMLSRDERETRRYRVLLTVNGNYESLRKEVKAALSGWQPADASVPFSFSGGELQQISGSLQQWADNWTVTACAE